MAEESAGEIFTRARRRKMEISASITRLESQRIFNALDYYQGGSRSRLRTVQRRLKGEIQVVSEQAEAFYGSDIQEIYRQGLVASGLPPDYQPTRRELSSITSVREEGQALSEIHARRSVRTTGNINKFRKGERYQAEELGHHILNPRVGDSGRWANGTYQSMLIRSDAQRAYNLGIIDGGVKNKVQAFLCSDGADCGLISHDDPFKVNGELFNEEDARAYLLAHPNCTRTFSPVPGEPPPKGIKDRRRDAIEESKFTSLIGDAIEFSQAQIDVNLIGLAFDLATDAQLRQVAINAVLKSDQQYRAFRLRIDEFIQRHAYNPPSEDAIFQHMTEYIDNMAAGEIAPDWVYELLDMNPGQILRTADGESWTNFVTLTRTADRTHAELNMMNRIQAHYGDFFASRVGAAHPDLADRLGDFYRATRSHYLEPRYSSPIGRISLPRLGGEAWRGPRWNWLSRPIKIQSTIVNTSRHMTRQELRAAMEGQGLVAKVVRSDGFGNDIFAAMVRKEMIDALGYKPGLLSHLTINPGGTFRAGFRLSPTGWIQPDLRIVPDWAPLRYTARLNRGAVVDGVRLRSITQELSLATGGKKLAVLVPSNTVSLQSIGISTRTLIGRVDSVDDAKGLVRRYVNTKTSNIASLPLPQLRIHGQFVMNSLSKEQIASYLGDAAPSARQLDRMGKGTLIKKLGRKELVSIIEDSGVGLTGPELLMRQSEMISIFAELRIQGFNRFDISKILRLDADEVTDILKATDRYFGPAYRDRSMTSFMHASADAAMDLWDKGIINTANKTIKKIEGTWEATQLFLDDFGQWISTSGKKTFLGRIYRDAIEGYHFVGDFKKGTFGADLIAKYGPVFTDPKKTLIDIYDATKNYDWKDLAKRAIMTPPQLARHMGDLAKSMVRGAGVVIDGSSNLVRRLLSDTGPIRTFFKGARRIDDGSGAGVYALGNIFFDADTPGRKGKGWFLGPRATIADSLKLDEIKQKITEEALQHYEDVAAQAIEFLKTTRDIAQNGYAKIRSRMASMAEWLEVRLNDLGVSIEYLKSRLDFIAGEIKYYSREAWNRFDYTVIRGNPSYRYRSSRQKAKRQAMLDDSLEKRLAAMTPEERLDYDRQIAAYEADKAAVKAEQARREDLIARTKAYTEPVEFKDQDELFKGLPYSLAEETDIFKDVPDEITGLLDEESLRSWNALHGNRYGLRADTRKIKWKFEGDASYKGLFDPSVFDEQPMFFVNHDGHKADGIEYLGLTKKQKKAVGFGPPSEGSRLAIFAHEHGHYQDFDFSLNNTFISDRADDWITNITAKLGTNDPDVFLHPTTGARIDFNTLMDSFDVSPGAKPIYYEATVKGMYLESHAAVYGRVAARITPEIVAQAKLLRAARNTRKMRNLREEILSYVADVVPGAKINHSAVTSTYEYLNDPREIWARLYSQRILELSGKSFEEAKLALWTEDLGFAYHHWDDDELAELIPLIDDVLRARGVYRR